MALEALNRALKTNAQLQPMVEFTRKYKSKNGEKRGGKIRVSV